MMAMPHLSKMSVEEYFQLLHDNPDIRYEYIDGWSYALAGGTLDHARIAFNVARVLDDSLQGGCQAFTSDASLWLSNNRYVFPDVTVSCDERDRGKATEIRYPKVIVEVLSPGTMNYDRGKKFLYYRECPTLQEYVIIYTEYQAVEVFKRERQNLWTLRAFGPDDVIELISIDVRFPVSRVYQKTIVPIDDLLGEDLPE
ncbi:MAG: Uma2 family endonuclease [Ktedonobacteraceae bacterium]|nr:Uma2 family endonuclease [Ktedonobacteraceae bacterium]